MNPLKTPLWMQKIAFERSLAEIAARSGLRLPLGWRFFERSPLMRADHAAFLIWEGRAGAACAMTGAFGPDGFIATPFADDEAAADALLAELIALQRRWGARRIVAPVSPRLFDTDGGLAVGGLDAEASRFSTDALPFWDALLQGHGFVVTGASSLYALDEARFPAERYARAARESIRRFGYRVVSARSMGLGAACSAMARLARREPILGMDGRAFYESLRALGSAWSPETTAIALRGDEAIGYLLTLCDRKERILRAATVQVAAAWRRRGVTAALAELTMREGRGFRIEAGVIDDENFASRWCVENAGGRRIRWMKRYELKITNS